MSAVEDGTKLSERALGRRRHPPRIRRLCRDWRDGGCRMAQVCLLSVFATRLHGRKPLNLFVAKNVVDGTAARHRAEHNVPPTTRPPCAHTPTKHIPEDRLCRFVGGRRPMTQNRGLPSLTTIRHHHIVSQHSAPQLCPLHCIA